MDKRLNERGSILVVLLLLVVVATLIGMWGMSATRHGLMRAGNYRGGIKSLYEAEEGLQMAVRRIQELSDPTLTDSLYLKNIYTGTELGIAHLLDGVGSCVGSACGSPDPSCTEDFNPTVDLDTWDNNVICNFMGTALERTQVILVRKDDHVEGMLTSAVFLINAISRDPTGRRKIVQGVAILPYEGPPGGRSLPPGAKAYLATVLKGSGS